MTRGTLIPTGYRVQRETRDDGRIVWTAWRDDSCAWVDIGSGSSKEQAAAVCRDDAEEELKIGRRTS